MLFIKRISKSEAKNYNGNIEFDVNKSIGKQLSYNLPSKFFQEARERAIIIEDESIDYARKYKDGNAYVLSNNYSFELGNGILDLIGHEYKYKDNKFIGSVGFQNRKFQLFRMVYDNLNQENYSWFVKLYDENFIGNDLIIEINENKKIMKFDIRFN